MLSFLTLVQLSEPFRGKNEKNKSSVNTKLGRKNAVFSPILVKIAYFCRFSKNKTYSLLASWFSQIPGSIFAHERLWKLKSSGEMQRAALLLFFFFYHCLGYGRIICIKIHIKLISNLLTLQHGFYFLLIYKTWDKF